MEKRREIQIGRQMQKSAKKQKFIKRKRGEILKGRKLQKNVKKRREIQDA